MVYDTLTGVELAIGSPSSARGAAIRGGLLTAARTAGERDCPSGIPHTCTAASKRVHLATPSRQAGVTGLYAANVFKYTRLA